MQSHCLVLSCEHASRALPAAYQYLLSGHQQLFASHRGHDIGAYFVFQYCQQQLNVPHIAGRYSRLLIDLNRTLGHTNLFSELTQSLDGAAKQAIIDQYYLSYVNSLREKIMQSMKGQARVLHLSIHSFTPTLHNETRNADIGLLYDPQRSYEKKIAQNIKQALLAQADYHIRFNYPYRGTANGLTTFFRRELGDKYCGLELEMNQKLFTKNGENKNLAKHVAVALQQLLRT